MKSQRITPEDFKLCRKAMRGLYKLDDVILKTPTAFVCICKSNRADIYQRIDCGPFFKRQFKDEKITVIVSRFEPYQVIALEHKTLQVAFESIFSNTVLPKVHVEQTDQYLSSFARAQTSWRKKMDSARLNAKEKEEYKEALKKIEEIKERIFKHI